ncbi:transcriptional regulator with XRE-family HTH domain [Crossiella equi]|uniref:Transcriptional regulator with XRE-family HTH domain n=1 Tax=Crossiella equi TaxID=130796 RepID=A0ABS5A4D5_9PSEU|nr:helix-turn-helix transcriptional regulator [Crossiella equi]MBP2471401.1 transcriptional regulator with XRE-family HTH domain [Crossiella equi]
MVTPKHAILPARSLGGELRTLRKERGLTCVQVAEELGWQASKISRMETGKQGVTSADAASMLAVYRVVGDERQRLLGLAERPGELPWWELSGPMSEEVKTLIRLENEAIRIDSCQPLVIPGLLQTPDYTRALLKAAGSAEVENRVAVRMGRQAVLSRDTPPEYHAIMDEMALRRVMGSNRVMARQMRQLLDTADRPSVTLQVLPFSLGGHAGLDGPFTLLDFATQGPVAFLDHKISGMFLDKPEEMAYLQHEVDKMIEVALSPARSVDFIADLARAYEQG